MIKNLALNSVRLGFLLILYLAYDTSKGIPLEVNIAIILISVIVSGALTGLIFKGDWLWTKTN